MLDIQSYDWRSLPDQKVDWIWEGYLAAGAMTVLASPPKAGKSTLLFHLLRAMREGQPFLNLRTRTEPTLLFTEEAIPLLRQRQEAFGDLPLHVVPLQPGLTWPKILALSKLRAQEGYRLVIMDTISRFWPVQNEGDAVQVLQALTPLLTITRQCGFALLLIHHTRKSGGAEGNAFRGSNALMGTADIGVEFGRITPWDRGRRRRLDSLSRYGETPDSLIIELGEDGYHTAAEGAALEKDVMLLVTMEGSATAEQVAETSGQSLRSAQRTLAEMVARGVLDRTGTGGPRSPFHFTLKAAG